jgi:hypothetical protein
MVTRTRTSAAALLAFTSLAGAVLTSCGNEEPVTRDAYAGSADPDRAAVERVSPELPQLVSEFRRARNEADSIPGDPAAALQQTGDAQPGEDPALSRRLELAGGRHTYAWPMENGVCYSWPGAVGCTPTAVLAQKGVLVGTGYVSAGANPAGKAPEWQVFALARDGISELHLALVDGSEITREIRNNGVLVTLPNAPTEARWQNPNGTTRLELLAARFP